MSENIILGDTTTEKFTGVKIELVEIDGVEYTMVSYKDGVAMWGMPNNGEFPYIKCAICDKLKNPFTFHKCVDGKMENVVNLNRYFRENNIPAHIDEITGEALFDSGNVDPEVK